MQLKDDHAALTDRLKAGDSSAFERIYHAYKRPLFLLAQRYLKDKQLSEDALQEVFIKLWNHRSQLQENLSLRSFLYVSLKHHVLNVIRSEQNRIRKAALAAAEQPVSSPLTELEVNYRESKKLIDQGMATLSESKRKILLLSLIDGYSHQEIANMLSISEHTVRSQISQSNKLMREYMKKAISLFAILSGIS